MITNLRMMILLGPTSEKEVQKMMTIFFFYFDNIMEPSEAPYDYEN